MDTDDTAHAGQPEEPETMAADNTHEGATESIHAWSLADDGTEVTPYEHRSWKIPAIVAAVVSVIAVGIAVGIWGSSNHSSGQASTRSTPSTPPPHSVAAPPTSASPPAREIGGQMVETKLHLDGAPKDWAALKADLWQQGISIEFNVIGVVTHLEFAEEDTAPGNWVRWYTQHVVGPEYHSSPAQPNSWFLASAAGLPVPPPPEICYRSDGSAVPIAKFPGPYTDCGPTPGALAGH